MRCSPCRCRRSAARHSRRGDIGPERAVGGALVGAGGADLGGAASQRGLRGHRAGDVPAERRARHGIRHPVRAEPGGPAREAGGHRREVRRLGAARNRKARGRAAGPGRSVGSRVAPVMVLRLRERVEKSGQPGSGRRPVAGSRAVRRRRPRAGRGPSTPRDRARRDAHARGAARRCATAPGASPRRSLERLRVDPREGRAHRRRSCPGSGARGVSSPAASRAAQAAAVACAEAARVRKNAITCSSAAEGAPLASKNGSSVGSSVTRPLASSTRSAISSP